MILLSRLRTHLHPASTAASVSLAATVAVVVNIWTNNWKPSTGIGLAALIVCQVTLECFRERTTIDRESPPRRKLAINQRLGKVRDGDVIGVRRFRLSGDVEVRQHINQVENSRVVGIEEVSGEETYQPRHTT